MTDNYYIEDMIESLKKDVVMERYYPLINCKEKLLSIMRAAGIVRRDEITETVIESISSSLGDDIACLFTRFIHIYDFNKSKLREIKDYTGTEKYDTLAGLLRLPGVRLLRAELYFNSGVTLAVLAEKTTEEIREMVRTYIQSQNRTETVPLPKEVNCHREVAKMLVHTELL